MIARRPAHLAGFAAAVATIVILSASPASAHTVSGVPPTNYRTTLLGISPPVPDLSVHLLDLGKRIQLVNHTGSEIVVLGYQDEPYLRVGPAGVFANLNAPDYYRNQPVAAGAPTTTLPPRANPTAAPDWARIGSGSSVTWRDRRTRWEGPAAPQVRAAPGRPHLVVPLWSIPLQQGIRPILIEGQITWVPGPRAWTWLLVSLGLATAVVAIGVFRRPGPVVAVGAAIIVPVSLVHAFGAAQVSGGSVGLVLARALASNFYSVPAWVLGIIAAGRYGRALGGERSGDAGVLLGGVCGLWLALLDGALDIPTLGRSQVPSGLPGDLARAAATLILGVGAGMAIVAAMVERHRYGRSAKPAVTGG